MVLEWAETVLNNTSCKSVIDSCSGGGGGGCKSIKGDNKTRNNTSDCKDLLLKTKGESAAPRLEFCNIADLARHLVKEKLVDINSDYANAIAGIPSLGGAASSKSACY